MLFTYKAVTQQGEKKDGEIDAANREFALKALQERGFYPTELLEKGKKAGEINIPFIDNLLNGVKSKDVVIMSRQISTLFTSQVSAVKAFSMLAGNSDSKALQKVMQTIVDDIQSGTSISGAMAKHPSAFSSFYVNMVKAGEESGKLPQVFGHLADYLDRQYALNSKIKNALIYPSFIMFIFFTVMILMFTKVIPNLAKIIRESGVEIPSYTKVVIAISDLMVNYGFFMLIGVVGFIGYLYYVTRSKAGRDAIDKVRLKVPVFGPLFTKLYLARISDNMDTMLSSGISIVRAIEITEQVLDSAKYKEILHNANEAVKTGKAFSEAMDGYKEVPQIFVQMMRVGEETGSLAVILKTLSDFYKREVDSAVDTLISLIEPAMIVLLGLGVGTLLVSVMIPIYNIAGAQ